MNFIVKKDDPHEKELEYKVYLICDSYIGCDQAETLKI